MIDVRLKVVQHYSMRWCGITRTELSSICRRGASVRDLLINSRFRVCTRIRIYARINAASRITDSIWERT